jgi:phage virion morphogenesis protein
VTGAVITVRFFDGGSRAAIGQLIRMGTHPAQLLGAIGTGMVRNVHDRFQNATGPGGVAWQKLNDLYATTKRGPGILRGAGMRGGLMGSITRDVQGHELAVGTNKVYGAVHQFGATIVPKRAKALRFHMGGRLIVASSVTIPPRPYLGWDDEDEEVVLEVTGALFDRAIAAGASVARRQIGGLF